MSMILCMASMMLGAFIFAAGIAFERLPKGAKNECATDAALPESETALSKQWENLLEYDGNEQEEELCE